MSPSSVSSVWERDPLVPPVVVGYKGHLLRVSPSLSHPLHSQPQTPTPDSGLLFVSGLSDSPRPSRVLDNALSLATSHTYHSSRYRSHNVWYPNVRTSLVRGFLRVVTPRVPEVPYLTTNPRGLT